MNFQQSRKQVANYVVVLKFVRLFSLEGINEFEARWIGWAGVNVPDEVGQRSLTKSLAEKVRKLGFCMKVLLISDLSS